MPTSLSSREFEGSIQRYQWFFSELPEMLCESEMEIEQHTCWSGQDVVERFVCLLYYFNATEGPAKHQECTSVALTWYVISLHWFCLLKRTVYGKGEMVLKKKKYIYIVSCQARAEISGLVFRSHSWCIVNDRITATRATVTPTIGFWRARMKLKVGGAGRRHFGREWLRLTPGKP